MVLGLGFGVTFEQFGLDFDLGVVLEWMFTVMLIWAGDIVDGLMLSRMAMMLMVIGDLESTRCVEYVVICRESIKGARRERGI